MCPVCQGIGQTIALDTEKAVDHERSLNEGAILLPGFSIGSWYWKLHAETGLFDPDKKIKEYTPEEYDLLMYAQPQKITTAETGEMNVPMRGS